MSLTGKPKPPSCQPFPPTVPRAPQGPQGPPWKRDAAWAFFRLGMQDTLQTRYLNHLNWFLSMQWSSGSPPSSSLDQTSHLICKGEGSHPAKETHFGRLYPWPAAFSPEHRKESSSSSTGLSRASPCDSAPSSPWRTSVASAPPLKLAQFVCQSPSLFDPFSWMRHWDTSTLHTAVRLLSRPGMSIPPFPRWAPWPQIWRC